MELALEVKFTSAFTELSASYTSTVTNGSDVKYMFSFLHRHPSDVPGVLLEHPV